MECVVSVLLESIEFFSYLQWAGAKKCRQMIGISLTNQVNSVSVAFAME